MTQPAKAQEPSMEEILASIRRIIADDDATKTPPRAPEPPKSEPEPAPPQPVFSAPPAAPPVVPPRPRFEADAAGAMAPSSPPEIATVADQASDILDLTEFDGGADAAAPTSSESFGQCHAKSCSISHHRRQFRRGFRRIERAARPCRVKRPRSGDSLFRAKPALRSIPPSMRLPRPYWCRMPARWRIWSVKCFGRC